MIKKISLLVFAGVLSLGAKIWVNAIRDPGAELGQGDWQTNFWEWPEASGVSDSVVLSSHDSTRAFEGKFSFRTDTEKYPGIEGAQIDIWCFQNLKIKKAVKDVDSCEWSIFLNEKGSDRLRRFYLAFKAENGKRALWYCGRTDEPDDDTTFTIYFPLPDSGQWSLYGGNLYLTWNDYAKWQETDSICEVILLSQGRKDARWYGQDISWDNIYLASVAYYDYAAKSIDSDSLADKSYTPIVTFANEGIKADKDAWVYAEIIEGTSRVYIDSQQVSIPKESSQQLTFKAWSVPHTASYTLRAYAIQELDELSSDDTLEKALTGTAIAEPPTTSPRSLSLQIEAVLRPPSSFLISYSIPNSEHGTLTLYDPSGRRIESYRVQGEGQVAMKAGLSSGVYFIRLETEKMSVTKKTLLLR